MMPNRLEPPLSRPGDEPLLTAIRASFRGQVIYRAHPEYDRARRVWNGMIDRHPLVIARCTSAADVVEAVRLVRERGPLISIRGGTPKEF